MNNRKDMGGLANNQFHALVKFCTTLAELNGIDAKYIVNQLPLEEDSSETAHSPFLGLGFGYDEKPEIMISLTDRLIKVYHPDCVEHAFKLLYAYNRLSPDKFKLSIGNSRDYDLAA